MLDTYADMLKGSFNLKGRVNRHNYWLGLLIMLVILCVLIWFAEKIPTIKFLPAVYSAGMVVPTITASVRRLHDVGRAGWWVLAFLVPAIGWIGLFVYLIQESETEERIKEKAQRKAERQLAAPRLRDGY